MINVNEYLAKFCTSGKVLRSERIGSGHINETYVVFTDSGNCYTLQRINNYVFKDVDALMSNIDNVTQFIYDEAKLAGDDPEREIVRIIPTKDGKLYYKSEKGCYWRVYTFIDHAVTFNRVENPRHFFEAGRAFGMFQKRLKKFDASKLYETIPNFHNTPVRYKTFLESVEKNVSGRLQNVLPEVEFVKARAERFGKIEELLSDGAIPNRVTHNDTKLNNVLFDAESGRAISVIDLDTVMPSTLLYDFGDAIRFGCNTGTEETENLDLVHFNIDLFEVFARGFIEGIEEITELEAELLPFASWLMTIECGMRFLTDYLDGDVYFRIHSPEENKFRTRTQLRLAEEMEEKMDDMAKIISEILAEQKK